MRLRGRYCEKCSKKYERERERGKLPNDKRMRQIIYRERENYSSEITFQVVHVFLMLSRGFLERKNCHMLVRICNILKTPVAHTNIISNFTFSTLVLSLS